MTIVIIIIIIIIIIIYVCGARIAEIYVPVFHIFAPPSPLG